MRLYLADDDDGDNNDNDNENNNNRTNNNNIRDTAVLKMIMRPPLPFEPDSALSQCPS